MIRRAAFLWHERVEQKMALIRLAGNHEPRHGLEVLLRLLLRESIGSGPLQSQPVVGTGVAHHAPCVSIALGDENRLDARLEHLVVERLCTGVARANNARHSDNSRGQNNSSPVRHDFPPSTITSFEDGRKLSSQIEPATAGSLGWGGASGRGPVRAIPWLIPWLSRHPRRGCPRTRTSSASLPHR